jgi:hypothetical protein
MSNTTLTADIIAKEAVMQLDNNLVMAKQVYNGYDEEFSKKVNGYNVGETISIRRPMDFTVRNTITMNTQTVTEGKFTMSVNKIAGIDFEFTSQDLTQKISTLSERVIKPAMIQIANEIDVNIMANYKKVPSWVGTPGQTINSYTDFAKGPERMDELANPMADRSAVLSPADHWGLLGSQTSLYMQDVAKGAYREGSLGKIGGVDTYMAQNVPTHTVGALGGTPLVNGASQNTTYAASKNTDTQTLNVKGGSNSITGWAKAGDVFTIAGVYAVNPVTKATLPFLRQFTVMEDANTDGSGLVALTIRPAIITDGAFKTCSAAPADEAALTFMGTAATGYRQNLMFSRNAFAFVSVPLISPPGAVDVARQTYKGISVRVIPVYDGVNDVSKWRLDCLYGTETIDSRLAHRASGTA